MICPHCGGSEYQRRGRYKYRPAEAMLCCKSCRRMSIESRWRRENRKDLLGTYLSDEVIDRVAAALRTDRTYRAIGGDNGINQETVSKIAKRLGLAVDRRRGYSRRLKVSSSRLMDASQALVVAKQTEADDTASQAIELAMTISHRYGPEYLGEIYLELAGGGDPSYETAKRAIKRQWRTERDFNTADFDVSVL